MDVVVVLSSGLVLTVENTTLSRVRSQVRGHEVVNLSVAAVTWPDGVVGDPVDMAVFSSHVVAIYELPTGEPS